MHREYQNIEEKNSEISELIFFRLTGAKWAVHHFWKNGFDSCIKV